MHTPWGNSQTTRKIADGITSVSTAGHGGYRISPARWAQLERILPNFQSFTGPYWLEEDSDWAAAPLCWPEYFADADIWNALRSIGRWHTEVDLEAYDKTLQGVECQRRAAAFAETIKGKWEIGGCGGPVDGAPSGSWWVNLIRGDERTSVVFTSYPMQQFYSDAEIEQCRYKPEAEKQSA